MLELRAPCYCPLPAPPAALCVMGNILEFVTVLPRSPLGITQGALKKVKFVRPAWFSG